jgi:adenine-specific DNA-methyltransferase
MPSLQFKGKNIIWNHHQSPLLPTHTLNLNKDLSYNAKNANGNIIVEGDNLLALKALLPEYQGKVDCIYIDPPYNTGNEGWVYNDKVNSPMINDWIGQTVGKEAEDFTRHDKWLCMMTPRLKLLHEMLSDKGVIFVSIDDNEQANLKLLMDEIFGAENFICQFIWQKIHSTKNDAKYVSDNHEYVIAYAKNKDNCNIHLLPRTDKMNDRYQNSDKDPRGDWASGDLVANEERKEGYYEVKSPKTGKAFNVPQGKHWVYSQENMLKYIAENRIWFGKDGNAFPRLKRYLTEVQQGKKADTILLSDTTGHNQEAKREINNIFDSNDYFDTPKPTRLIKLLLTIATSPSSIILDSFAGSGTTAQAVLELNKEDGGNRQFVLVQMPEEIKPETPAGKYCVENNLPLKISSITRERVRLAIDKKINPIMVDSGALEGLETERKEIGFEYYNLGTPLDSWSIISSQSSAELPSFGKLASYIWKNLTGEKREFALASIEGVNKFHLGDYKGEKVFLLYEQDLPKLNGRELCMSLPIAKELEELYPNTPKLIYSPTCYLDDWHREKYQIRYINFPFGV